MAVELAYISSFSGMNVYDKGQKTKISRVYEDDHYVIRFGGCAEIQ